MFSALFILTTVWSVFMEIQVGAQVFAENEEWIGEVVKVVRDTWSGEVKTLLVSDSTPANAQMFSVSQVLEAGEERIRIDTNRE